MAKTETWIVHAHDNGARDGEEMFELEGVGVTQSDRQGTTYQVRLKFGKQAYCVVELQKGEDPQDVARKLLELAAQVAARSDV